MKNRFYVFALGALFLIPSLSDARGEREGHGGLAVVCRDPQTKAIDPNRLEVLDLNEGRLLYGLKISPSNEPSNLQIERVVERLGFDVSLQKSFRYELGQIRKYMNFTSENVGLELLPDVSSIPTERFGVNCKIEQLAIYDSSVLFSQPIYSKLNNLNLSAIFVHEVIYRLNRLATGTNRSVEAREFTAHLFSDDFNEKQFRQLIAGKLPTIETKLSSGATVLKLVSSEPVVVEVSAGIMCSIYDKMHVSVALDASTSLFKVVNFNPKCGTHKIVLPYTAKELEYAVITTSVIGRSLKKVKFKVVQGKTALVDQTGKDKFELSDIMDNEFVFFPKK